MLRLRNVSGIKQELGDLLVRHHAGDRSGIDDNALLSFLHVGNDGLDAEERAGEIDRDHAGPVVLADFLGRAVERIDNGRVVPENVDLAKC